MYVCPDCKSPLRLLHCQVCGAHYRHVHGIPVLLSRHPAFERALRIASEYDSIYSTATNVWENQGRTPQFSKYFSSLVNQFRPGRLLEIGCGEGFLLASLTAGEKFAVDLSTEALSRARTKTVAQFSVALAERLPFPSGYFDVVASVGVMEHFLDIDAAMREIRRVLSPGGYHVALTHVELTLAERLALGISKYVLPRPKPVQFGRWLRKRLRLSPESTPVRRFPKQPIQNRNTTRRAKARFQGNGFDVIDVIHTRRHPELPLIGPWVVIYVARRSDGRADAATGA